MASGVYCIENVTNGRRYIGSAVDIQKRWKEHRRGLSEGRHHSRFMQRCWDKYGEAAFSFRILIFCAREHVLMYEQILLDAWKPEYNTSPTAGSQFGYRHSEETRAKMSEARRKDFSPMTGKSHTEETKKKISETKRKHKYGKYDKERVARVAAAMRASKNAMGESEVSIIRRLNAQGRPHREVAQWVGRSYWAVADVVRNRTFKWVK